MTNEIPMTNDERSTRAPKLLVRACRRINFVGSLCRKLCRNTPLFLQNSTKFATKAADKEPRMPVLGQSLARTWNLLILWSLVIAHWSFGKALHQPCCLGKAAHNVHVLHSLPAGAFHN